MLFLFRKCLCNSHLCKMFVCRRINRAFFSETAKIYLALQGTNCKFLFQFNDAYIVGTAIKYAGKECLNKNLDLFLLGGIGQTLFFGASLRILYFWLAAVQYALKADKRQRNSKNMQIKYLFIENILCKPPFDAIKARNGADTRVFGGAHRAEGGRAPSTLPFPRVQLLFLLLGTLLLCLQVQRTTSQHCC